jgi:FkbM family methyltransferase
MGIDIVSTNRKKYFEELRNVAIQSFSFFGGSSNIIINKKEKFIVVLDKFIFFWIDFQLGIWEPKTTKIFDALIAPTDIYIDLGAWIGPTVLYASRLSKKVYAFEPSFAFYTLQNNVEQNKIFTLKKEIVLINKAAGIEDGYIYMGNHEGEGNSTDSILIGTNKYQVQQVDIIAFINSQQVLNNNTFIKVDIEGAEYTIVREILDVLSSKKNSLCMYLLTLESS